MKMMMIQLGDLFFFLLPLSLSLYAKIYLATLPNASFFFFFSGCLNVGLDFCLFLFLFCFVLFCFVLFDW
ncbi:hypothetical protein QBC44DRAFT_322365 [Cladorrhinum sp. PSN332]|nr:hypothetical protein QBC44DRAFT_322365 [Cladorrhinum sp. PSN332]